MYNILALLVFLNAFVAPILWVLRGAYCFALALPQDNLWATKYQELKYRNKLWNVFPDYDFMFGSLVVGDVLCGILMLIALALLGNWMFIPVICGAILCYLRYNNQEKPQ